LHCLAELLGFKNGNFWGVRIHFFLPLKTLPVDSCLRAVGAGWDHCTFGLFSSSFLHGWVCGFGPVSAQRHCV
jgi:hypothetical protein